MTVFIRLTNSNIIMQERQTYHTMSNPVIKRRRVEHPIRIYEFWRFRVSGIHREWEKMQLVSVSISICVCHSTWLGKHHTYLGVMLRNKTNF